MRQVKYKDLRRHHLSNVKSIDFLLEENWRIRQKFSKITRKHNKDGNVILYDKFSIINNDLHINKIISPDKNNSEIVFMSGGNNLQTENEKNVSNVNETPSQEKLEIIFNKLKKEVNFLIKNLKKNIQFYYNY